MVEVVAFPGAFADAGEDGDAAVAFGDVVDKLLNEHGLADAGAAEEADLAAFEVGGEEVDDLDSGDEDLGAGGLVLEGGGRAVDGVAHLFADGTALIDGLADDV